METQTVHAGPVAVNAKAGEVRAYRRYLGHQIMQWAEDLRRKLHDLQTEVKWEVFRGKCGFRCVEIDFGEVHFGTRRNPDLFNETNEQWAEARPRYEEAFHLLVEQGYLHLTPLGGERYRVECVLERLAVPLDLKAAEPGVLAAASGASTWGVGSVNARAETASREKKPLGDPQPPCGLSGTGDAADEPFIPNGFQEGILAVLNGKALRTDLLGVAVGDRRRLYRPGGLKELRENGRVGLHSRIGHYRPDAPPPELAQAQKRRLH